MTIFKHEMKRDWLQLMIWTAVIGGMSGLCILIYPQMASQMDQVSDVFSSMGGFSAVFGLDRINFGEFSGFFGVECGNIISIGGAFFAAMIGINSLAKEEDKHTADYLLTHPISRTRVVTEKLLAAISETVILDLISFGLVVLCMLIIGEDSGYIVVLLMMASFICLHIEILAISFGISSCLKKSSIGIGLGIAIMLYFVNIVANLTEDVKVLKYFTPFGYTDGADIIVNESLDAELILIGAAISVLAVALAFVRYKRKDIA